MAQLRPGTVARLNRAKANKVFLRPKDRAEKAKYLRHKRSVAASQGRRVMG